MRRDGRFVNPVLDSAESADHGDPFVLRHGAEHLLFHTTDDGRRPVSVHRSPDLVSWTRVGDALTGGHAGAETDLWAAEFLRRDRTWRIYVAATRRLEGGAMDSEAGPGGARVGDLFAAARPAGRPDRPDRRDGGSGP